MNLLGGLVIEDRPSAARNSEFADRWKSELYLWRLKPNIASQVSYFRRAELMLRRVHRSERLKPLIAAPDIDSFTYITRYCAWASISQRSNMTLMKMILLLAWSNLQNLFARREGRLARTYAWAVVDHEYIQLS